MKSRFITDPLDASQDASDGFFDAAGEEVFTSFSSSLGRDPESPSAGAPAEILATPAFFSGLPVSSTASARILWGLRGLASILLIISYRTTCSD